jgi:two-component system sensor histidine kinase TctE
MHKRERSHQDFLAMGTAADRGTGAGSRLYLAGSHTQSEKVDSVAARLGAYETDNLTPVADTESMPAEIAPLISAINRLITKLSEEQDSQKRFISNAAHQLRTPLATLQVQTQRVLRERDPLKHDQALGDVHGQSRGCTT